MPVRFERATIEEDKKEKYHDIILASFKFAQMALGVASTLIHVVTIFKQYESTPHVVLFCGTYFGFSIISAGLMYEYIIGDRNPNHLEIFFCAVGGLLFSACNNLTMYVAKKGIYSQKSKYDPIAVHTEYFHLAKVQSILSAITAMSYWVDFFINLDIWRSYKVKQKRQGKTTKDFESTVVITIGGGRGEGDEIEMQEEEEEEGEVDIIVTNLFLRPEDELQLHAFCIEFVVWLKKWFREDFKVLFKRRKKKVFKPITEVDFDEFVSIVYAYQNVMEGDDISHTTSMAEAQQLTQPGSLQPPLNTETI